MEGVTVELVGGPCDGVVTYIDLEFFSDLPPAIALTRNPATLGEIDCRGRYVRTRKLSRTTGHLIYEYREYPHQGDD